MVSRPILFPTQEVKENYAKLKETGIDNFVDTFYKMYVEHIDGKEYYLSDLAQKEYDEMVDSYAELLNDEYNIDLGKLIYAISRSIERHGRQCLNLTLTLSLTLNPNHLH